LNEPDSFSQRKVWQQALPYVVPLILFVLLAWLSALKLDRPASFPFAHDDVYRYMVLAETWHYDGVYGLSAQEPVPMVRDVLWIKCIALMLHFMETPANAAVALGVFAGALCVVLLVYLSRMICRTHVFSYIAPGMAVMFPGLVSASLSGQPTTLAFALLLALLIVHIKGAQGEAPLLSLRAAFLVAVLALIRIEFIALWIVLGLHAAVLASTGKGFKAEPGTATVLMWRWINGLWMTALFLMPLVSWNLKTIRVPWPRLPGVPLGGDSWLELGVGPALSRYMELMGQAIGYGYAELLNTTFLSNPALLIFACIGVLAQGAWLFKKNTDISTVVLSFVLVLSPVACGIVQPFTGWNGIRVVLDVVALSSVVLVALAVVRAIFEIEAWYEKRIAEEVPWSLTLKIWWGVMGGVAVLIAVVAMGADIRKQAKQVQHTEQVRELILEKIDERYADDETMVHVTDRPGWLRHALHHDVLDLSGEWSVPVLRWLDSQGRFDPDRMLSYMDEKPVGFFIIWNHRIARLAEHMPSTHFVPAFEGQDPYVPIVFRVTLRDDL